MESGAGDTRFRMRVGGMTCPSCEHHVEKALSEAGARDVAADFRRGEALLSVNGPPDAATLANAVQGQATRLARSSRSTASRSARASWWNTA